MIINISFNKKNYQANLTEPLDISLRAREGNNNPNCYWADPIKFETIRSGDFVGSVAEGGSLNYQKLIITPHGNGTHTECYGHLSSDNATINQCLQNFHFISQVISITPKRMGNGDLVLSTEEFQKHLLSDHVEAIVLRTLPNSDSKKNQQYSGTNPPYLEASLAEYLVQKNIQHLLIDLPSVDRESDEGKLLAHKAFWKFPSAIRKHCTITELVFIDNQIKDGLYLLNLQITSLEMDASPSKPVLYKLQEVS